MVVPVDFGDLLWEAMEPSGMTNWVIVSSRIISFHGVASGVLGDEFEMCWVFGLAADAWTREALGLLGVNHPGGIVSAFEN